MTDIQLGIVRQVTPLLTVRQDGGVTDVPVVPRSNESFVVGDRVILERVGKQVYALGTKLPVGQSVWQPLPYTSAAADIAGVWDTGAYLKTNGVVYWRGLLKAATAIVSDTTVLFTMPVGFRQTPQGSSSRTGMWNSQSFVNTIGPIRFWMDASGAVFVNNAIALNSNFSVSNISYPADS